MTENMRARVEKAVKESNGKLTIESAIEILVQKQNALSFWTAQQSWKQNKSIMSQIVAEIEYFQAVIEYLTEVAATEAVAETVQVLAAIVTVANKVKAVRRAVATLANKLHRLNYSLSDAFKRAWTFTRAFTGLISSLA